MQHPQARRGLFATLTLFALLLTAGSSISAQGLAGSKNLDRAFIFNVGYGPYIVAGNLADRFGNAYGIDGGVTYLAKASNWQFGLWARYGFGSEVKEDVLADLRTHDGFVIGNQREPADVQLRQRQLFVGPSVGYTFPLGENQRAGVHLRSSLGYLYHRIRIQPDAVQGVAPLFEELVGGYDRLTGGLGWYQFVGYQLLSENRRINFYLGLDAMAAFTRPLRDFDVATGAPLPDDLRTDLTFGARVGLSIPIYLGEGREIFYK